MSELLIEDLKNSNQILRKVINEKKKIVDDLREENRKLKALVDSQACEIGRLSIIAGELVSRKGETDEEEEFVV